MPIRTWVADHLESILTLVFGVGGSGVAFQIWDRRRLKRAAVVAETIDLSDEWRKMRHELRKDIEYLRKQLEDQESALRAQRIRIRELESANLSLTARFEEQSLEIARLQKALDRCEELHKAAAVSAATPPTGGAA